jgi:hypothetical protein
MAKLWVFLLATASIQVSIFWLAGAQAVAALRERRTARVAAAEALALVRMARARPDRQPVADNSHTSHDRETRSARDTASTCV